MNTKTTAFLLALLGIGLAGCKSIGPKTISRDRFDYSSALAESWKSQMLLNVVKVRYLDLPIFLEVGQVVSGYTLETTGSVGGQLSSSSAIQGNSVTLGGAARYTDRPTITYLPLTGDRFLEGFLTPIQPVKIFSLIQSGYAADFILELGVDSFNGLRNQPVRLGSGHPADPEFYQLLTLLAEIQDAGAIGLRVIKDQDGKPDSVVFFRSDKTPPDIQAKIAAARQLLEVPDGTHEFRLVYSPLAGNAGELALGTRSLSQMMSALAIGVEVPAAHVERRLTPPLNTTGTPRTPLLTVHSGKNAPADAYAAIAYEDQWFWVNKDDWRSKRTFTSILFLFTLAETGNAEKMPVITIPAQ